MLLAALLPLTLGQSPLTKAWNEALPGVQPFWEKYQTGPHGVVIRGWQFSRCASEQVTAVSSLSFEKPFITKETENA